MSAVAPACQPPVAAGPEGQNGRADALRELVLRLTARLPPADIIQLPTGGYLVVRRRGQGGSSCGRGTGSTQLAACQLRRAASCPLAGALAQPAPAPPAGAPAGWGADQERRYQRQLAALRHAVGQHRPLPRAPAGSPAPERSAPVSCPVPVPAARLDRS
ncbi:hypothetical protein ABPG75_010568 [Micractinium tetrahymenae]